MIEAIKTYSANETVFLYAQTRDGRMLRFRANAEISGFEPDAGAAEPADTESLIDLCDSLELINYRAAMGWEWGAMLEHFTEGPSDELHK